MVTLPRLVIAAPASGHGKTTVATGLMAALSAAGHVVSGHKVGPDYIDPGYHALATGKPGHNLDPHLVGEDRLVPLLLAGASSADLAIIEGVMGLYDGQIGSDGFASTAHVATVTKTPVVLVVDISHASRSIAAVVQGMVAFDSRVRIVGVILNKAGSERHADEVCRALESTGVPVLGVLQRDDGIVAPSRHLGLVPADERGDAAHALDRLSAQIAAEIDLERFVALARQAPGLDAAPWNAQDEVTPPTPKRPVVAIAGGRAFTFRYTETEELLRAAGCEIAYFDPLADESLPDDTAGIYLGGGFPEVHATGLTANEPLRAELREAVQAGVPTLAECAGLLYLCRTVDGSPMVGALEADAAMTPRLTLSYRQAVAVQETLLSPAGGRITGHEFHRTTVDPTSASESAWLVDGAPIGFSLDPAGAGRPTLHASYLHTHWAGHPAVAQRFADAVHASTPVVEVRSEAKPRNHVAEDSLVSRRSFLAPQPAGLRHHGDAETGEGLVDFAVNIYDGDRPGWLQQALIASLDVADHYPHAGIAESAIAQRHARSADEVLATAGAAEAFGLISRLRPWRLPVVVHPQFTEPDVALATAGHTVNRVICDEDSGFALDPDNIPEETDLVFVGNPTNPTSILHSEKSLRRIIKPGRIVVVDEAFMDAVPGEKYSLASARIPGLIVIRSLTKLWAIPGIRAGYLLAEPHVIAELRAQQTPWSVSSSAAAAMKACMSDEAVAEAASRASTISKNRAILVDGLAELDIAVVSPAAAPFVLAKTGDGVHKALRDAGYAVRRADTFPGLGPEWVRIAVRRPDLTRKLLSTLRVGRI